MHSDLPFFAEKIKIKKWNKLACNLYDKKEYVIYIKSLKQTLNHGLILKKYIEKLNLIKKHGSNHLSKWIIN